MSHRVLETDFPLMAPPNPPTVASTNSDYAKRYSNPSPSKGDYTARYSSSGNPENNSSSWQRRVSLNRSGSLRRAYSESSSDDGPKMKRELHQNLKQT